MFKKYGACLALLTSIAALATPAPDANHFIAEAKQASGGTTWDKLAGLHEQGTLTANGLAGHFEQWLDLKRQRRTSSFDLGPESGSDGWDGEHRWSVDSSGDLRIETSAQSQASAVQNAYRQTFGFFFPGRHPAAVVYAGVRNAGGHAYDAVKVTPKGADPFEIWFDRKTHLISREVQSSGDEPQTFLFSDWRKAGPVLLPWKTTIRTAGDPRFDQVSHASSIQAIDQMPQGKFAQPRETPTPALWPAGRSSVTVPFRLINNHIYVRASINGRPPADVIFDTGATDILDRGHAKRLDVKIAGALPIGGIGSNVASYGLARVKTVSIGGLTLVDQVCGAVDLDEIERVEDADFQGLVGYEYAKRAVITIDYAAHTLTFTKPADFLPPDSKSIPFAFREHTPIVSAEVDGIAGQFELDTGARTGLMIMAPFAKKHGFWNRYAATPESTVSYGVGGPSRARLARIGTLEIAGTVINSPVAELATGTSGDSASNHIAGNIGGDILQRFRVTFDYAHQRLWLEPNALNAAPEQFDRSGLWLSRAPDGDFAVGDVAPGSAAQSAGIEAGDEIIAVNGTPSSGLRLYELREAFERAPGTKFMLRVKHGTRIVTRQLVLANRV
jgi:hypothetical protein